MSILYINETPIQLFYTTRNSIIDDGITIEIAVHQRSISKDVFFGEAVINQFNNTYIFTLL